MDIDGSTQSHLDGSNPQCKPNPPPLKFRQAYLQEPSRRSSTTIPTTLFHIIFSSTEDVMNDGPKLPFM
jgi:hypothetical protein